MRPVRLSAYLLLACLLWIPAAAAQDGDRFTVTVVQKTAAHPFFGQGWPEAYAIGGVQGPPLTLVRGRTYTFQMQDVPSIHPFYLTTSEAGGGASAYSAGVEGNGASGSGSLTFTPGAETPDVLYYNCENHPYMGGRIMVTDPPAADLAARLELVADGLVHPVALAEAPDGSGRLFVVDQTGQIYVVTGEGERLETPFLDVSDRIVDLNENYDERGLLGLAFHPDYASNGRFFVHYSAPLREAAPDTFNNTTRISAFTASATDPNLADPASETVILEVDQPQGNHAGGTIAFGPDGYLYIALGDGGGRDDEGAGHVPDWYAFNAGGNGQDLEQNLLGSILRIDVDAQENGMPYAIPDDNPFLGTAALPEQWAYGFRNPYRMAFDPGGDRELFVGDAGQDLWEEVSVATAGGNYGWNVREGAHCFDAANPQTEPAECPDAVGAGHPRAGDPLIDPIIEFNNSDVAGGLGLVVVGGHVYRGALLPALDGRYLFGVWSDGTDAATGAVYAAERPAGGGMWPFEPLTFSSRDALGHYLLSFGQDADGEVYLLTTDAVGPTGASGRVYRLAAPDPTTAVEPGGALPSDLHLGQNYPNPFNPSTTIRYRTTLPGRARLTVYDVMGREITRLVDVVVAAGTHEVRWDARDAAGRPVPSGIYVYRLELQGHALTRVMTLLR